MIERRRAPSARAVAQHEARVVRPAVRDLVGHRPQDFGRAAAARRRRRSGTRRRSRTCQASVASCAGRRARRARPSAPRRARDARRAAGSTSARGWRARARCRRSPAATAGRLRGCLRAYSTRLAASTGSSSSDGRDAPPVCRAIASGLEAHVPARLAHAGAEVDVLAVEEERVVEAAEPLEHAAADQHARARHPVRRARPSRRRPRRG